jgi:transcription elongation factor Elf1
VESIVEAFEGYGFHDVAPTDQSADLFLRLRGDFIGRPYCYARNRIVDPVRRGQLMCCNCWEPIICRTETGGRPADVQAVINARAEGHDDHEARLAERYEERIDRAGEEYRTGSQSRITHEQRWDAGRAVVMDRNAPLHCRTCWAAGGAIRERLSAWLHPPWAPVHA